MTLILWISTDSEVVLHFRQINISFFLFYILFTAHTVTYTDNEEKYNFKQYDMYYSFEFDIQLPDLKQDTLQILFDYENLEKITGNSRFTTHLISANDVSQTILYNYNFLIYKAGYIYFREQKTNEGVITFKLISSEQNLRFIPFPVQSNGYYKIIHKEEKIYVRYFQENILNKKIPYMYSNYLKKEIKEFYVTFNSFINTLK